MDDEIEGYYHFGERAKSMEKSNTREEILEAALDLFAVNGYEATSIS
jgi:AcrR family transcriptional regulator